MLNNPLPIGYIEVQRSWTELDKDVAQMLYGIRVEMALSNPKHKFYGSRLETTKDGAGVEHFNLYVGYAPAIPLSEPLNPRNLNAAEHAEQIGDPGRDMAIGMKEQKF